jgi:hypothetical protein
VAGKGSPVKYIIITDTDEGEMIDGVTFITAGKGDDIPARVNSAIHDKGLDLNIVNNSDMSIAVVENSIGAIKTHYGSAADPKAMFNFLIADSSAVKADTANIPAATLLNLLVKLASADKTSVMAVGAERNAAIGDMIEGLKAILKNALRLIWIKSLKINEMVEAFITSMKETARSL